MRRFYKTEIHFLVNTGLQKNIYFVIIGICTSGRPLFSQKPLSVSVSFPSKNDSWFWSDGSPLRISGWTNQRLENTTAEDSCMQIEPKSKKKKGGRNKELESGQTGVQEKWRTLDAQLNSLKIDA